MRQVKSTADLRWLIFSIRMGLVYINVMTIVQYYSADIHETIA